MNHGTGGLCSPQEEGDVLEDEVLRPVQSLGALRVCGRRGIFKRLLSCVPKEAGLTEELGRPQTRSQRVWRRWKRASGFRHLGDQQRFWRTLDPGISGFVVSLFTSLFALPLELTWWDVEWDLWRVLPLVEDTGPILAVTFVGVWWANSVGLGWRLQQRLPASVHLRRSRWLLICLLVGLPLVGFHFFVLAYQRLAARAQDGHPRVPAKLDSRSGWIGVVTTRLVSWWGTVRIAGGWILPWYLASIGVFGWAVLWLAAQQGPRTGLAVLVAAGSLHVVAFGVRWNGGPEAAPYSARESWEARFHRVATWLLLLPHPVPLLWIMVFLSDPRVEKLRSQSIVRAAFRSGTEVGRLPRWRGLSRILRGQWEGVSWNRRWLQPAGEQGSRPMTLSVRNLGTLYRFKTALTFFDGVLFGQLLSVLVARRLVPPGVAQGALGTLFWGGLGMVLLGSATLLGCWVAVLLRWPVRFHASGLPLLSKFLVLTFGALVLGYSTGYYLGEGDLQSAGVWLALPIALFLSFIAFGVILRPACQGLPGAERCLDPTARLVWILAPITLAVVGVALAAGGTMAQALSNLLVLSGGLCPLAHATLAWSLGGWLLRPFTVRDLTSRSLPSRRRRALRLLAATLVLPLGGLAVPWWIFLRSRWMSAR